MMVDCGTESSTVTHQPLFLEIVRLSRERLGQAYGTWQQQQQIYLLYPKQNLIDFDSTTQHQQTKRNGK